MATTDKKKVRWIKCCELYAGVKILYPDGKCEERFAKTFRENLYVECQFYVLGSPPLQAVCGKLNGTSFQQKLDAWIIRTFLKGNDWIVVKADEIAEICEMRASDHQRRLMIAVDHAFRELAKKIFQKTLSLENGKCEHVYKACPNDANTLLMDGQTCVACQWEKGMPRPRREAASKFTSSTEIRTKTGSGRTKVFRVGVLDAMPLAGLNDDGRASGVLGELFMQAWTQLKEEGKAGEFKMCAFRKFATHEIKEAFAGSKDFGPVHAYIGLFRTAARIEKPILVCAEPPVLNGGQLTQVENTTKNISVRYVAFTHISGLVVVGRKEDVSQKPTNAQFKSIEPLAAKWDFSHIKNALSIYVVEGDAAAEFVEGVLNLPLQGGKVHPLPADEGDWHVLTSIDTHKWFEGHMAIVHRFAYDQYVKPPDSKKLVKAQKVGIEVKMERGLPAYPVGLAIRGDLYDENNSLGRRLEGKILGIRETDTFCDIEDKALLEHFELSMIPIRKRPWFGRLKS